MQFTTVKIEKPNHVNFILGQTHFIKTVEDIHEALVTAGGQPVLRCWSAGCASGEEVYTLNIIWKLAVAPRLLGSFAQSR
jgi:adenosine/AMP kinase